MFDPILSVAVVAYVATMAILYFVVLDRPEARESSPPKGTGSLGAPVEPRYRKYRGTPRQD